MNSKDGLKMMVKELLSGYSFEDIAAELLAQTEGGPTQGLSTWGKAFAKATAKAVLSPGKAQESTATSAGEKYAKRLEDYARQKNHFCGAVIKAVATFRREYIPEDTLKELYDGMIDHVNEEVAEGNFITEEEMRAKGLDNEAAIDAAAKGSLMDFISRMMMNSAQSSTSDEERYGTLPPKKQPSSLDPDDILFIEDELPELSADEIPDNLEDLFK